MNYQVYIDSNAWNTLSEKNVNFDIFENDSILFLKTDFLKCEERPLEGKKDKRDLLNYINKESEKNVFKQDKGIFGLASYGDSENHPNKYGLSTYENFQDNCGVMLNYKNRGAVLKAEENSQNKFKIRGSGLKKNKTDFDLAIRTYGQGCYILTNEKKFPSGKVDSVIEINAWTSETKCFRDFLFEKIRFLEAKL